MRMFRMFRMINYMMFMLKFDVSLAYLKNYNDI